MKSERIIFVSRGITVFFSPIPGRYRFRQAPEVWILQILANVKDFRQRHVSVVSRFRIRQVSVVSRFRIRQVSPYNKHSFNLSYNITRCMFRTFLYKSCCHNTRSILRPLLSRPYVYTLSISITEIA